MKTIAESDISILYPHALSLLKSLGRPSLAASDDSISGLAYARANAVLFVKPSYCNCPDSDDQFYYSRPNGSHGWFCGKCYGITQVG